MKEHKQHATAVLMGDIVSSQTGYAPARLYALFNAAVADINTRYAPSLLSPLTITLGDEFQGLPQSLAEAAEIARDLRLALLVEGVDCRFVIGQTRLHTPINPNQAWNMMGDGLARARQKLNDKQDSTFYRFALLEAETSEILLDAIGLGLSAIETDWTAIQLHTLHQAILGHSADEIATARSVSTRSVYKTLKSSKLDSYTAMWTATFTALRQLEER